ncbi:hypothetical protein PQ478_08630 [Alkalihalophilus pseudofirmus]|uniref:hypothetical protein n=1 Tax=Alkalihalophilus pseudofirmus TaxID=79885 RepID=UPI00259BEE61|nr:hypothetical protein [Alkalihalophilus pseudofirmus]WEG18534.1 hypothetical protein PQ478_08630 [Alkalihalophilus pseudofirmus]
MQKNKFYFCYSPVQHKYLHNKKGLAYICSALHETTHNKFWLYENNDTLSKALEDYREHMSFLNN